MRPCKLNHSRPKVALWGANPGGTVGQLGVDRGESLAHPVIADEIAAATHRIIEGIRVGEDTLALDTRWLISRKNICFSASWTDGTGHTGRKMAEKT